MEWVLLAIPTVTSVVGVRTWVLGVLTSKGQKPILNKPNKNKINSEKEEKLNVFPVATLGRGTKRTSDMPLGVHLQELHMRLRFK